MSLKIQASSIPIPLLQLAWPDGYLAIRGMSTIGGWTCINVNDRISVWARTRTDDDDDIVYVIRGATSLDRLLSGSDCDGPESLLPNVDPADFATWACLLQGLASLLGAPEGILKLHWQPLCRGPSYPMKWILGGETADGGIWDSSDFCFRHKLDKPAGWELMDSKALTLVCAYIATRERIAKKGVISCD